MVVAAAKLEYLSVFPIKSVSAILEAFISYSKEIEKAVTRKSSNKIQFNTAEQNVVLNALKEMERKVTKKAGKIGKLEGRKEMYEIMNKWWREKIETEDKEKKNKTK